MHGNHRRAVTLTAVTALTVGSMLSTQTLATAHVSDAVARDAGATRAEILEAGKKKNRVIDWHVAPSILKLLNEVDARWPGRDRSSDGHVGDYRHSLSRSEHNPVGHPNGPAYGTPGAVHALDITANGIDVDAVLSAVVGDSRVQYVIHAGKIYSAWAGWGARVHSGDPHYTHIHISLRNDTYAAALASESNTSSWLSGSGGGSSGGSSGGGNSLGLVPGASGPNVAALQRALIARGFAIPAGATGNFGDQTKKAVKKFQKAQGWNGSGADGVPGAQTLRLLGVGGGSGSVAVSSNKAPAPTASASGGAGSRGALAPGVRGPQVVTLQRALMAKGFTIPAGATGFYGDQTKKAVKKFQKAQGWRGKAADGVPGPMTMRLLGL